MNLEELITYMEKHPCTLTNGAGYLSKRLNASIEDVKLSKAEVKKRLLIKKSLVPKILIFDVETAPMEAYIWKLWKLNIAFDHVINEWYMICWSAKWLYSNEVIGDVLTPEEALSKNDKRIVSHLWELINAADIVVAYNGKKADVPWMNTRFILNGILPPKPYIVIDPCEIARKLFDFPSNKMDALAKYFGYDAKLDTDFLLWVDCIKGKETSLNYMLEYNKRDVTLLEEIYIKMRPWIKNHPSLSNILERNTITCCSCGSEKYEELIGLYYYTLVGKYQLYRCNKCKSVFRGRKNLNTSPIKTISTLR